jgi:hypothetical protein
MIDDEMVEQELQQLDEDDQMLDEELPRIEEKSES